MTHFTSTNIIFRMPKNHQKEKVSSFHSWFNSRFIYRFLRLPSSTNNRVRTFAKWRLLWDINALNLSGTRKHLRIGPELDWRNIINSCDRFNYTDKEYFTSQLRRSGTKKCPKRCVEYNCLFSSHVSSGLCVSIHSEDINAPTHYVSILESSLLVAPFISKKKKTKKKDIRNASIHSFFHSL